MNLGALIWNSNLHAQVVKMKIEHERKISSLDKMERQQSEKYERKFADLDSLIDELCKIHKNSCIKK